MSTHGQWWSKFCGNGVGREWGIGREGEVGEGKREEGKGDGKGERGREEGRKRRREVRRETREERVRERRERLEREEASGEGKK